MLTSSFKSHVHFQWQQLCHLNKVSKINHCYNLFESYSHTNMTHLKKKAENDYSDHNDYEETILYITHHVSSSHVSIY